MHLQILERLIRDGNIHPKILQSMIQYSKRVQEIRKEKDEVVDIKED